MKKLSLLLLSVVAVLFTGCYAARIITAPTTTVGYSTTVTYPTTPVSTNIYASDSDLCLHLDLQAVGAAFAQSSSVREFEILLNNSSYMISNLDLNRDGYIDYLRVIETLDRYTHIFLIQAVLGANVYQDVATLIVENPSYASCYVEIIGAPYIYGQKYIVRPIFKTRPYIYTHLCSRNYAPWRSPWHWDYYPSHYHRPAPKYLSHYQAYVDTYMRNHHYCHEVLYPSTYHYANYDRHTREFQRNDYAVQHPERSFSERTAQAAVGENSAVRRAQNARDVREAQEAASRVTTTNNSRATANTASSSSAASTSANRRTSSNTATSASSASRNTAGTASSSTSASRSGATTSTSSSRSGATTSTSNSRSSATTSSSSNRSTATSGSSATRSSSSTSSATRSGSTSSSSATRSAGTSSSTSTSRSGSSTGTTVNSRVSNSGSARTTTTSGSSASRSSSSTSGASRSSSTTSSATRSSSSTSSSTSRSAGTSSSTSSSRSGSSTGSTSTSTARRR